MYDKYLEPDDLVGYYGLGDGWIFDPQPKGANDAALREQIVGSVQKAGEPHVYSSIETCVGCLATQVGADVLTVGWRAWMHGVTVWGRPAAL